MSTYRKEPGRWPRTGSVVVRGARFENINSFNGPSGASTKGLRVRGPGTGNQAFYELFYDAVLTNVNTGNAGTDTDNTFTYRYDYYFLKVTAVAGNSGTPAQWIPDKTSTPKKPEIDGSGQVVSIYGVSIPSYRIRTTDTYKPGDGVVAPNPTPYDFGWSGTGQGTSSGTPSSGPGTRKSTNDGTGEPPAGTPAAESDDAREAARDAARPEDSTYNTKVPGWGKKRRTLWNPPPARPITGAYVPTVFTDPAVAGNFQVDKVEPPTRSLTLGTGGYGTRLGRKGYITQFLKFEHEWAIQGGSTESAGNNSKGKNKTGKPQGYKPSAKDAIIEPGIRYGFRFHYNPESVTFGLTEENDIDPAVIVSGADMSFPMDSPGSSITFNLYINRIEDMSLIYKSGKQYRVRAGAYGPKRFSQKQLEGIKAKGTNFDLEYLFMCGLGRPMKTHTRGTTSDLGMIYGVPVMLSLGGPLTYVGRLTNLSYSHLYFTHDMVPTLTSVSMSFIRIPDVVAFGTFKNWGGS